MTRLPPGALPALPTMPTGASLQRLADEAWARDAGRSELYFEGSRWTGDRLADRIRRLSGGLRAAGIAPGERVVVCMANCPEVTVTYHAIWRAGAVATPVLFLLSEDELRHVLTDSAAVLVVTTPEFLPKVTAAAASAPAVRAVVVAGGLAGADGGVPLLDFAALESAAPAGLIDADPASLAALLYTGGTTGRSKGVMISHNALSAAAWAAAATSYDPAQRIGLLALPLSHVYGLMVSVLSLHVPEPGVTVLMRWFDPSGWLQLAERHKVNVSPMVPSMLQMLLQQPLESYDLSALTRLNSGAAPLPRQVIDDFRLRLPQVEIAEGYGCTESAAIIATSPLGRARPGSVGLPAPGVQVRIELRDGSEARPGEDGEICVRGAVLMSGYWNAPEETAKALRGGYLHTGDVGRLDADGYLSIVDRIKDLIIRGGYNVYPRDVEDVLVKHPAVVAAAVVGRPDPTYGEEVVAFVQVVPGSSVKPEELVAHAKQHLSAVKYPREVRIVDAIPLTSVLKTDRKRLRAQLVSEARPAG
ncbi:MAG: class I adenylate-forming enzyme family protein [Streptosporangiaceae bacterium]